MCRECDLYLAFGFAFLPNNLLPQHMQGYNFSEADRNASQVFTNFVRRFVYYQWVVFFSLEMSAQRSKFLEWWNMVGLSTKATLVPEFQLYTGTRSNRSRHSRAGLPLSGRGLLEWVHSTVGQLYDHYLPAYRSVCPTWTNCVQMAVSHHYRCTNSLYCSRLFVRLPTFWKTLR